MTYTKLVELKEALGAEYEARDDRCGYLISKDTVYLVCKFDEGWAYLEK